LAEKSRPSDAAAIRKALCQEPADAEAIAEAVQRPTLRFVPIKSADQQAVLMLHRTRDLLILQRSSLISAIRAHFAEFGIVVGQGIRNIERLLGLLETAGDRRLPALAAEMLGILAAQLRCVAEQVKGVEVKLLAWPMDRLRPARSSRPLEIPSSSNPVNSSRPGLASCRSNGRAAARNDWGHQQARRRLYPAVAGAWRSCDRWMAKAVGDAQNAMDRAALGAPAPQCCNGGLRQQACAHRLGDHDARKSIQSCSGFYHHFVIGWRNSESG